MKIKNLNLKSIINKLLQSHIFVVLLKSPKRLKKNEPCNAHFLFTEYTMVRDYINMMKTTFYQ